MVCERIFIGKRAARESNSSAIKTKKESRLAQPKMVWKSISQIACFSDQMVIQSDLLVLASAVVPQKNNPLAPMFKISQNADGFFAEAHVKLRPNDFATDGVFVCGLAHAPKPIEESISQAQAAASRAVTVLSQLEISVSGTVALIDPNFCSSCGVCVEVCPYSAPKFNENTAKAEIQSTLCKGCGLCVASCRSGAIHLKGFDTGQIMAMIQTCLFEEAPAETTFS